MFLTIAHRGDPLVHRENTLPSLLSAVAKGANTLEFDVRQTKDGQIVLLHDANLARLWGTPAAVGDVTFDELRSLDSDGYQVPALDEVLAQVPQTRLLVDLKTDEVIAPTVATLRRHDAFDRAIFVAARRDGSQALLRLRAAEPAAAIGLDWTAAEPPAEELLAQLRPQYIGPRWRVADAAGVPALRERGYRVWVGPINAEADLTAALRYGVDGIVSDDVDLLLRLSNVDADATGGPSAGGD